MAATINIYGLMATADGYEWECRDPVTKALLDTLLDPAGPSGADPNPDYHLALAAIEEFGAEMVRFDDTEWEPGLVY